MTPHVTWETLDWKALDRLRARFLGHDSGPDSYWEKASDVANYDFTFAQRIAWKWDAVLSELARRGWTPPVAEVLDWGCGSGIASRRFVHRFGAESFKGIHMLDRTSVASGFAVQAGRREFPGLAVDAVDSLWLGRGEPVGIVLLSHVLNELTEEARISLRALFRGAAAIVWVEAGTREVSRELGSWRDALLHEFTAIAPCTHQAQCGILMAGNERHWCHHFAAPPLGIMGDSNWVRFAQRAGIDLRSLPYSYVVMERKGLRCERPGVVPEGFSRVIGAPRIYKGFARVLSCQAEGVREFRLQKRFAPDLFRAMKDGRVDAVYRWELRGDDIESAASIDRS